jgi:hypothetical protein
MMLQPRTWKSILILTYLIWPLRRCAAQLEPPRSPGKLKLGWTVQPEYSQSFFRIFLVEVRGLDTAAAVWLSGTDCSDGEEPAAPAGEAVASAGMAAASKATVTVSLCWEAEGVWAAAGEVAVPTGTTVGASGVEAPFRGDSVEGVASVGTMKSDLSNADPLQQIHFWPKGQNWIARIVNTGKGLLDCGW